MDGTYGTFLVPSKIGFQSKRALTGTYCNRPHRVCTPRNPMSDMSVNTPHGMYHASGTIEPGSHLPRPPSGLCPIDMRSALRQKKRGHFESTVSTITTFSHSASPVIRPPSGPVWRTHPTPHIPAPAPHTAGGATRFPRKVAYSSSTKSMTTTSTYRQVQTITRSRTVVRVNTSTFLRRQTRHDTSGVSDAPSDSVRYSRDAA